MTRVKPARILSIVGLVVSFGGWFTMRRTEAAILSTGRSSCNALATVSIRGHEHLTCSHLAASYHAGAGAFAIGWLILLVSIFGLKFDREA
jgi:hypothetical protein